VITPGPDPSAQPPPTLPSPSAPSSVVAVAASNHAGGGASLATPSHPKIPFEPTSPSTPPASSTLHLDRLFTAAVKTSRDHHQNISTGINSRNSSDISCVRSGNIHFMSKTSVPRPPPGGFNLAIAPRPVFKNTIHDAILIDDD
jgi:hypothetical protein